MQPLVKPQLQPGFATLGQHNPALAPARLTSSSNCTRPAASKSAVKHAAAHRTHRLVVLAMSEPFAASNSLPLASMSGIKLQAGSDLDDFFSASPFSTMRRFDEMMDRQMQQMDPFSGSSTFSNMRSMQDRMQQQMQEMDQQFDRAFADMDRAQQQLDAELQRSLRQLQEQQPGVRIERREEQAPGAYRYYESIQIRSGTSFTSLTPAHTTPFFNPLLLMAVVIAGAYAAVTAAFARNYELTTYGERSKWKLLLLWPVLVLLNKPFWRQFSSALRGERVKAQDEDAHVKDVDDAGVQR